MQWIPYSILWHSPLWQYSLEQIYKLLSLGQILLISPQILDVEEGEKKISEGESERGDEEIEGRWKRDWEREREGEKCSNN